MLPAAIKVCLQGIVPAWLASASADNVPNATTISQVFYVDDQHVAVSNQFFGKTTRNLDVNPQAHVQVIDPGDCSVWLLEVTFLRRETEGPLFESMSMQLDAIASMMGAQDIFKLRSADVCRVDAVHHQLEAQRPA